MFFSQENIESIPAWLCNSGPDSDAVISTRVRLAHNLADHRFPLKASFLERGDIFDEITHAVDKAPQYKE